MTGDGAIGVVLGIGWAIAVASAVSARARRRSLRRPSAPAVTGARAITGRSGPGAAAANPGTTTIAAAVPPALRPLAASAVPAWSRRHSPVDALGRAVRRLAGGAVMPGASQASGHAAVPSAHPPASEYPLDGGSGPATDEALDRRTGWATLASGGLLLIAPLLAAAPLAWALAAPMLASRRHRDRQEAALHDQLPDVVDLLAITTAAGLPVGAALVAVDDRPGGPLGAALARASTHVRHGGGTADALAVLASAGPPVRPLVDALVQHDRYGTPLLPALERVGIEARARRRRRAEEAARRLPVTLLFPLVLTTFPAFVLLTVVPLLAGSLGSLSLSPT